MKHYDAIVVGCGAMGSSVSYNLASRGLSVLTLERFGLNHEFGSSHGRTRITRLAYFEDPRYVPLLRRSFAAWDELAKDPVNQRWQKEMGRLFEPVPDQQPGERFAMMKEVFYLE